MNPSSPDGDALSLPLLRSLHLDCGDSIDGGLSYPDDRHDNREHDDRQEGGHRSSSPDRHPEGYIWTPNGSPRLARVCAISSFAVIGLGSRVLSFNITRGTWNTFCGAVDEHVREWSALNDRGAHHTWSSHVALLLTAQILPNHAGMDMPAHDHLTLLMISAAHWKEEKLGVLLLDRSAMYIYNQSFSLSLHLMSITRGLSNPCSGALLYAHMTCSVLNYSDA